MTTKKFYYVYTTAKRFPYKKAEYKDVILHWFILDRKRPPITYKQGIKGYKANIDYIKYSKQALKELFTFTEALALKDYIEKEHGGVSKTEIKEAKLPLDKNSMPFVAIPVGGGQDFYELYKGGRYNLPFKVAGYFAIR